MKLSTCGLFTFATLAVSVFAAPTLPIEDALSIATARLKEKGLDGSYYVSSIKLQKIDARKSSVRWAIDWSQPVVVNEFKKELGIEVAMDGSLTSIVTGAANRDPETGKFNPNGSNGLSNPRTRADRPSIVTSK